MEVTQLVERVATQKLARSSRRQFVTRCQIEDCVREILARAEQHGNNRKTFSLSRMIRGMSAMRGMQINGETVEGDVAYVRALQTGTQPGIFLVPVIQSNNILSQLSQMAVARAAGARIFDMAGIQEMTVPGALTSPSFVWQSQSSKQSPTDPNLTPIAFSIKTLLALLLMPGQLFKSAVPSFDVILEECFALGCAEAEDQAMFATSTLSNAPPALMSQAGITTINTGGSANGGNIAYSDVVAVMLKAAQLKMRPPFVWFCSPRTLFTRLLSLASTTSQPFFNSDIADPVSSGYSLMGWPIYVTASILENEVLGSGTNQSHMIFTNPRAINIAQNAGVEMAVSEFFALESNQIALRIGHGVSYGYAPAASIIALLGIN